MTVVVGLILELIEMLLDSDMLVDRLGLTVCDWEILTDSEMLPEILAEIETVDEDVRLTLGVIEIDALRDIDGVAVGVVDGSTPRLAIVTDAIPVVELSELTETVTSPLGSVHDCRAARLAWWSTRSTPTLFHRLIPTTFPQPAPMLASYCSYSLYWSQ